MKKKGLIIGIIAIVFVVIICVAFMFFNNNQVGPLDEVFNDKYAKLYWDYMNTEEFKKENQDVGKYTFIDLNFDKINELVFEKSNNGNKVYNIYTFENNNIILKDTIEGNDIKMSLVDINKLNFYCWLFIDYSNSGEGQTLNKKQWIYDYDFNKIDITDDNYSISSIAYSVVDYNTSQTEEEQLASFMIIFQNGQQFLEKNEFVQTYEIAKNKPDIKTIIFNTDNKNTNETEIASKDTANKDTSSNQKLSEVVQIGDYVNYMNSDTFWRVLNVTDKGSVVLICFTGTENFDNHGDGSYIFSLYEKEANKYKTEYSQSTSFVPHFNWIKDSYKKTHGVDISISSKLEGDLYNIGLDYYTVDADMKEYESKTSYITMDGKVLSNYLSLGNCYLRPTITLKTDVKTTGKNEKGAWILTN